MRCLRRILTSLDVLDVDFTRGEQVDSRDRSITHSHHAFLCVHVYSSEGVEVLEEGSVGGSHGEFDLGQLRQDTEEAHLGLGHLERLEERLAALVCQHLSYNY